MADLSDRDLLVLQTAEQLSAMRTGRDGFVRSRTGMSPARFTQRLLHLVIQHDVVADPRWTLLAHRVVAERDRNVQARASRTFARQSA